MGKLKKREWKAPRTADEASGNTLVQLGYANPCSLTAWMLVWKAWRKPNITEKQSVKKVLFLVQTHGSFNLLKEGWWYQAVKHYKSTCSTLYHRLCWNNEELIVKNVALNLSSSKLLAYLNRNVLKRLMVGYNHHGNLRVTHKTQ